MGDELMHWLGLAVAASCLWMGSVHAQMLSVIPWDTPHHYTGPGDNSAFTAWYGLRAYSAAKAATHTNIADLRRISDNATCTIKARTNGDADVATNAICNGNTQTVTAWIGASSAKVTKIYDQVGSNACGGSSCDLIQATTANQPSFILNCVGSFPCMESVATTHGFELAGANNFTPSAGQHSLASVANRSSGTQFALFVASNGQPSSSLTSLPQNTLNSASGANTWGLSGSIQKTGAAADAAWHASVGVLVDNPGTTVINIDGAEATTTLDTVDTTARKPKMVATAPFTTVTIRVAEGGFADNTAWTSIARTNICHNMRIYWGTGGSC